MLVYGMSGKSGTGKSFNAHLILEKYNITALLDDGLLIIAGDIVAGISAKKAGDKKFRNKNRNFQRRGKKK